MSSMAGWARGSMAAAVSSMLVKRMELIPVSSTETSTSRSVLFKVREEV